VLAASIISVITQRATAQKTAIFILTTVRTSSLTILQLFNDDAGTAFNEKGKVYYKLEAGILKQAAVTSFEVFF
jgi:hypothetical protein